MRNLFQKFTFLVTAIALVPLAARAQDDSPVFPELKSVAEYRFFIEQGHLKTYEGEDAVAVKDIVDKFHQTKGGRLLVIGTHSNKRFHGIKPGQENFKEGSLSVLRSTDLIDAMEKAGLTEAELESGRISQLNLRRQIMEEGKDKGKPYAKVLLFDDYKQAINYILETLRAELKKEGSGAVQASVLVNVKRDGTIEGVEPDDKSVPAFLDAVKKQPELGVRISGNSTFACKVMKKTLAENSVTNRLVIDAQPYGYDPKWGLVYMVLTPIAGKWADTEPELLPSITIDPENKPVVSDQDAFDKLLSSLKDNPESGVIAYIAWPKGVVLEDKDLEKYLADAGLPEDQLDRVSFQDDIHLPKGEPLSMELVWLEKAPSRGTGSSRTQKRDTGNDFVQFQATVGVARVEGFDKQQSGSKTIAFPFVGVKATWEDWGLRCRFQVPGYPESRGPVVRPFDITLSINLRNAWEVLEMVCLTVAYQNPFTNYVSQNSYYADQENLNGENTPGVRYGLEFDPSRWQASPPWLKNLSAELGYVVTQGTNYRTAPGWSYTQQNPNVLEFSAAYYFNLGSISTK
ncbi:MAG: hypothetical protein V1495_07195 [Pseudomonadota bacterium]